MEAAGSWHENFVADDVEPDHLGPLSIVEVTVHRGSHIDPQFVDRIGLGEDRFTNRSGGEATLGRLVHEKHEFDHDLRSLLEQTTNVDTTPEPPILAGIAGAPSESPRSRSSLNA